MKSARFTWPRIRKTLSLDFINVLAIMVASYYDFNIEYKLNGTLTFIQKFFLKIKDVLNLK